MYEFSLASHDTDVGRTLALRLKEDEVAGPELILPNLPARSVLLGDFARQQHTMLGEDVLHEPAAIES